MKKLSFKHTSLACYNSSVALAITNNLSPLLFIIYSDKLGLSLSQIGLLITVNFVMQIAVDVFSAYIVDRIGYRASMLFSHVCCTVGLIFMGTLPTVMPDKFAALVIATVTMATGSGLIDVTSGPIIEAMPGEEKTSAIGILHSFYCWGHAAVIILSTVMLNIVGHDNWFILPLIWTVIPIAGIILFSIVPINTLKTEGTTSSIKFLFSKRSFWLMAVIMLCAGASELGMAQWASYFAETGLHIDKTLGDLLGPCAFAITMAIGRVLLGIFGDRVNIEKWICGSFALCAVLYLITALSPSPVLSLICCAMCGISVAILWPGTFSMGYKYLPLGGTAMFSLFALMGDVGCSVGPSLIGVISDNVTGGNLSALANLLGGDPSSLGMRAGILISALFPILACIVSFILVRSHSKRKADSSNDKAADDSE